MRPQRPGETGVERREKERAQFVGESVNPQHLCRKIVVTDGDEGAPQPRARNVFRDDSAQHYHSHDGKIHRLLRVENDAAQFRWRHPQAGHPAENIHTHVTKKPGDDELRRERRHRQIKSLDAKRRQAKKQADHSSH